ncbi:hypothetical protein PITCH_A370002 [uncultured Desulfobacterium sp.]|uniref:Uncharacterized protein n=1 Tax=uncultured Desulfobacterium sp. TaxID=201089 RepID=A0A445MZK3_9BACT|nr:hypothetical protein PITCH_A370002 [uncultured Desulfobacterium sp.]
MVSPVNMMVPGIEASEPRSNRRSWVSLEIAGEKDSEAITPSASKSDAANATFKPFSGEQTQASAEANGEIRRVEIKDGSLAIKVYDSSGKLLRKIPPGYLPVGEQQFEVTI